jgi:cytochrome c-type biogenesis protein CcmF
MSTLGYLALVLASIACVYSLFAHLYSGRARQNTLANSARSSLLASCLLVSAAVGVLLVAILSHDFSLAYVAEYSSRDTSLVYLVTALWAGNDGSLLFWAWVLSIFSVIVAFQQHGNDRELVPYASAFLLFTEAFFIILLLAVANPFQHLAAPPADGRGLNPLLQNPGMIIHPPALLAGYVGFTVPFAFAVAAMLKKQLGNDWLAAVRRWTLLAWLLLGAGNLIGAWWAYVELGWGGYWAWDPVENAGLMPWLVATAFLHSSILQRRRGKFKVWNLVLIIVTFNLAIFGTFLTRSGFLSSLHTFGQTGLEPFFLTFLAITFFGSLWLLYARRDFLHSESNSEVLVSRENTFLLNNILLFGATLIVLFGTLFPAISEAVRGVRVELGASFFNRADGPVFVAIVLLIGICTLIGWRRELSRKLAQKFLWPLVMAVVLGVVLFIVGVRQGIVPFIICGFVFSAVLLEWSREAGAFHRSSGANILNAWWRLFLANRQRYGGYLVHLSILLITMGIIGSSFYDTEQDAALQPGEAMNIRDYRLVYNDTDLQGGATGMELITLVSVFRGEKLLYQLRPSKIYALNYDQPVTEVAIHSNPVEDLYVILAAWDDDTATFKVLLNPMVMWMWIGGGIFLLGGLVAFWPAGRKPGAAEAETLVIPAGTPDTGEVEKGQVQTTPEDEGRRFCPQCGARHQKGDRFCSECGAPLERGGDRD